jgi:hypothetical protein
MQIINKEAFTQEFKLWTPLKLSLKSYHVISDLVVLTKTAMDVASRNSTGASSTCSTILLRMRF